MSTLEILRNNAGALHSRRVRSTKTIVTIYNNNLANLDTEDGLYSTVCEDHGYLVNHKTQTDALKFMAHPEEWCDECRSLFENKTNG